MRKAILLGFVFILGACTFFDDSDIGHPVEIRLHNASPYHFENIKINTVNFGSLEAGEYSTYHKFEKAYSYSYVQLNIDTTTFTLQPFDYVGEKPLKKGQYTYELSLDTIDNNVVLKQSLITE